MPTIKCPICSKKIKGGTIISARASLRNHLRDVHGQTAR